MKTFAKVLCLVLSLLMVVAIFAACGDKPEETTGGKKQETTVSTEETGRQAEKDSIPTDLSFKDLPAEDRTVTFFVRNNGEFFLTEICSDELTGDIYTDAIHYRNIDVENRLGVKIAQIAQAGSETDKTWQTWNETLANSVLNKTGEFDAALLHANCGTALAFQNIYMNLMTCDTESGNGYLELSKPWWNQYSVDEFTYAGALFFLGGDIATTSIQRSYCIYFNKGLFKIKFPEEDYNDLYTLANKKQWTIDLLTNYVDQVWEDADGNGEKSDGDTVGWRFNTSGANMSTWVFAMGERFTKRDQLGLLSLAAIDNPRLVNAFEKVMGLYGGNNGTMMCTKSTENQGTTFGGGQILFSIGYLDTGSDLRDKDIKYGILPLPMYDEDQDNYYTNAVGHASLFALVSSLSADRTKLVTATSELMAAECYRDVMTEYYSKVLGGLYSDDQPDAEQYDRVLSTIVRDFASSMCYKGLSSMSGYTGMFKNFGEDFDLAQLIDSKKEQWTNGFEQLLDDLEDAVDRSLQ